MIDPISTGIIAGSLIFVALIGKAWAAQSGTTRIELAKIEASKNDGDIDMAIKDAEEARKDARAAREMAERFESRLGAAENRARR
jgi:hypothetical protein